MEKFKNVDIKKLAAAALLVWSAYFGHDKVKAQQELPRNPEAPNILENYSFVDIFDQEEHELSEYELRSAVFELTQGIYQNMPGDELSAEQIPDELKLLVAQSILQRMIGHGENVTATSENVLRYFGRLEGETGIKEGANNFDLRNLFDQNSIVLQRFEEGGKRGIRILFEVQTDPLNDFIRRTQPEVLNASLTFGTQQIIIYLEELQAFQEFYEVFIGDDVFYTDRIDYGYTVDSDGVAKPFADGEFLRLYTQEEVDQITASSSEWNESEPNATQIEPYYSRVSEDDNRFPGALDLGETNRSEVYALARNNPNTIFIAASGNLNSNSEIDQEEKPENLLFVGMIYDQYFFIPRIPGQSDIYIRDIDINRTELARVTDADRGTRENVDSSSEATAVVSSLITILKDENPDLSPEEYISTFTETFTNETMQDVILDFGDDDEEKRFVPRHTQSLRVLDINAVITGYSQNPVDFN